HSEWTRHRGASAAARSPKVSATCSLPVLLSAKTWIRNSPHSVGSRELATKEMVTETAVRAAEKGRHSSRNGLATQAASALRGYNARNTVRVQWHERRGRTTGLQRDRRGYRRLRRWHGRSGAGPGAGGQRAAHRAARSGPGAGQP